MNDAVEVEELTHRYPPSRRYQTSRTALNALSLSIHQSEIFGVLGPNGSGKSTLFRILSTLMRPTRGTAKIFGLDVLTQAPEIRRMIGVVFQHPGIDRKLTVEENLVHQGHLYGLYGKTLAMRLKEVLSRIGIADRAHDLAEQLSGGLQRRLELSKSLLHQPRLLLLDEPSSGLDPIARREFAEYLKSVRDEAGATPVLTTHLLDEAERCDRIAILDHGELVALGTPQELKQEIGGDVVSVTSKNPGELRDFIHQRFGGKASIVDGTVRIEHSNGHAFVPQLVEQFPGKIDAVTVSKPTLEDVFIHKTGHRFQNEGQDRP